MPERAEPDRDPRRHERRPDLRRRSATSRSRARATTPSDVQIEGQKLKLNVIRADRADGIYLKNFTVEFSDFNNIYVLETNGFRIDTDRLRVQPRVRDPLVHVRPRHLRELRRVATAATRASTRAPGPNARHGQPDAHGHVYGIRSATATRTTTRSGCPGTAGNGTWAHDNRFHHNSTGVTTDSFAGGHPGMPQDNSKWSHNLIYSNNNNLFNDERDAYCQRHAVGGARPAEGVPDVPGPGRHRAPDRRRQRQHRRGELHLRQLAPRHDAALGARPPCAASRTPRRTYDTSANNQYLRNCMSTRPTGPRQRRLLGLRGHAGQERRRLLVGRGGGPGLHRGAARLRRHRHLSSATAGPATSASTARRTRATRRRCCCRPARGWTCSGPGNNAKQATLVPCATWHPIDNPDPPGCDWFTTPPEPQ